MTGVPVPALTQAEQDLVHHYLKVIDLVTRLNPARDTGHFHTYASLTAAQALAAEATALLGAVERMWERHEREVHAATLARAMLALDAEARMARITIPPEHRGSGE